MTEGEIEIGKLYRLANNSTGAIYRKVSAEIAVVVNELGEKVGNKCRVVPAMQIIPLAPSQIK
ncbi:hypothetical protein V6X57_15845 [Serratia bockelmannii]|uniref:hypothetical protein n=1 Tax=Serratia bockelmannii TaxID=2703793 RepID=UPI002FE5696C|nr:hypothetical protein SM14VA7_26360 [Serratia marcescens]